MICEICLQGISKRYSRGPLIATEHPSRVYYRGKSLPLIGYQAELLVHLVRFGRASTEALARVCTGEDTDDAPKQVRVQLCHLRKRLPASVQIVSIYGWGYELVFESRGVQT